MAEEIGASQSENPLFSDFDRLSLLLGEAQELAKQNRNYNPVAFRKYFVVLAELQRFLYPLFGRTEMMTVIRRDVKDLDRITMNSYKKLLSDKDYKVSSKIFEALSDLHQDLLILKQMANLGIKTRERLDARKKLARALE